MSVDKYRKFNGMRSAIKNLVKAQVYSMENGEELFQSKRHVINQIVEDEARKIVDEQGEATCKNSVLLPVSIRIARMVKPDKVSSMLGIALLPNLK